MSFPKKRLFVGAMSNSTLGGRFLLDLCPITTSASAEPVLLLLHGLSTNRVSSGMMMSVVGLHPFTTHTIALQQLASSLLLEIIPPYIVVDQRVTALGSLGVSVSTPNLQIPQSLNIDVEIDWSVFLLAML